MFPLVASKMLLSRQSLSDMGTHFKTGGQIVLVGKQVSIYTCVRTYIYIYISYLSIYVRVYMRV